MELDWEEITMEKAAILFTSLFLSFGALLALILLPHQFSAPGFDVRLAPATDIRCKSNLPISPNRSAVYLNVTIQI
jgi:hypothetical protein